MASFLQINYLADYSLEILDDPAATALLQVFLFFFVLFIFMFTWNFPFIVVFIYLYLVLDLSPNSSDPKNFII